MTAPVIKVEGLGKRYQLQRSEHRSYRTLRESLQDWVRSRVRSSNQDPNSRTEDFWALQNVSFEVQSGEVLGIIGRNGAGKSTLLKILSRITEPTQGRIRLRGRVSSLLEVGTGFHPELTGRENIFLNGAIMGMKKSEIAARFDEIVAFAGVERFLDTPVKRYSSGMHVRLAFSVAAHLEPEILIVDEVLAVGEAAFQSKCLGKIQDVAKAHGRTVLFVSHNLSAVRQLTQRCLVLEKGNICFQGTPDSAINHYLQSNTTTNDDLEHLPREHECMGGARFISLHLESASTVFSSGAPIRIIAVIAWSMPIEEVRISLTLHTQDSTAVGSGFSHRFSGAEAPGRTHVSIGIPPTSLAPGRYHCTIALGLTSGGAPLNLDAVSNVVHFEILATDRGEEGPMEWNPNWGALRLPTLEVSPLL